MDHSSGHDGDGRPSLRRGGEDHVALVEAYWEGLRRGRLVPARADVDPRGIAGSLSHAFVLERIAPGMGRFRVAGMHVSDLLGLDVRGMPFSSLFLPKARDGIAETLDAVFSGPACATIVVTSPAAYGREALRARVGLMPLRSDMGDVSRILGVWQSDEPVGRAPRRFVIDQTAMVPLAGDIALLPRPKVRAEARKVAPPRRAAVGDLVDGMAEAQTPFGLPDTPERLGDVRPMLRIISSKD